MSEFNMEEHNVQENGYGAFPVALQIVAVICIILGFIAAMYNGFRERETVTAILWGAGGAINFLLWWALSYIVEACQRYIKNNKR